jgi:hypothetical protein
LTRAALLAAVIALLCAAPATAAPELVKIGHFQAPVHVAIPPDGSRVLVVEQGGLVKDASGAVAYDLRHLTSGGGERGLLSLAFPPDHAMTGLAYAFLTTPGANYDLRVVELPSERVVLSIPHPTHPNHNGGQLQFGPDGYLYVGTLFIRAMDETDVLWMGSDAVWTLPEHADADEIGDTLLRAAESCRRVPYRMRGELEGMRPLFEAANVRSHKAFAEGTRLVDAHRRGSESGLTPTRREGKSFAHKPDEALVLVAPGPAELADALRVAVSRSE